MTVCKTRFDFTIVFDDPSGIGQKIEESDIQFTKVAAGGYIIKYPSTNFMVMVVNDGMGFVDMSLEIFRIFRHWLFHSIRLVRLYDVLYSCTFEYHHTNRYDMRDTRIFKSLGYCMYYRQTIKEVRLVFVYPDHLKITAHKDTFFTEEDMVKVGKCIEKSMVPYLIRKTTSRSRRKVRRRHSDS